MVVYKDGGRQPSFTSLLVSSYQICMKGGFSNHWHAAHVYNHTAIQSDIGSHVLIENANRAAHSWICGHLKVNFFMSILIFFFLKVSSSRLRGIISLVMPYVMIMF